MFVEAFVTKRTASAGCAISGARNSAAPASATACRSKSRRVGQCKLRVAIGVLQTNKKTVRARRSSSTSDAAANTKKRTMITLRVA